MSYSFHLAVSMMASLVCASAASSQSSLTWIKDINTTPLRFSTSSSPRPARSQTTQNSQQWLKLGGYFYFQAISATNGGELFKSDGTQANLVKDIYPGASGSFPDQLTLVGSKIYFRAKTLSTGSELWVTDGTTAGTRMVKDIRAGSRGSTPRNLARVGNKVVFNADDGANGMEVWVSDGTAAGTKMLRNIGVARIGSLPRDLSSNRIGSKVFFRAYQSTTGNELWVTDGTIAGTKMVKDIRPGVTSSDPRFFQCLGASKVVFEANNGTNGLELWVSDGTSAGTTMVKDVYPGSGSGSFLFTSVSMGGKVVFAGRNKTGGREPWVTDGTAAGTMLLKDIRPGISSSNMTFCDTDGGKAYWGCTPAFGKYEIWVTDGTSIGTKRFSGWFPYPPFNVAATGGKVFFCSNSVTPGTGYELCMADGTVTKTVKDIRAGRSNGLRASSNYIGKIALGVVAFSADDGKGDQIWISKGSTVTTKKLDPKAWGGAQLTADDNVQGIETLFGKVIFSATDGTDWAKGNHGQELWISDGTVANTRILKDIFVGPRTTVWSSHPRDLCRLGGFVYFQAIDGVHGGELWRTDGTTSGTRLFKDTYPGGRILGPKGLTRIGDRIYFSVNDSLNSPKLWITDGTTSGTKPVPGFSGNSPRNYARLGRTNKAIFSAHASGKGNELWITDGTAAGTKLVKDISLGTSSSSPEFLTSYRGRVFFQAYTPAAGFELWVTDGTSSGTKMVKDGVRGTGSGYARYITVQADKLFYYGFTRTTGYEVHSSDGTAVNTGLFWDLALGTGSTYPRYLTAVGSRRIYCSGTFFAKGLGVEPFSIDVTKKTYTVWNASGRGSSSPINYSGGRFQFAVDSGRVYGVAQKTNIKDRQIFFVGNGATAESIGRAQSSSTLEATDPRIGTSMTVKGTTAVANPFSVLCLGIEDAKPSGLGSFVPGAFAYFDLSKFFLIVAGQTGKTWTTVLPVPNDVRLIGDRAVLQAFSLDVKAFPSKTEVTNGVHLTFGR